MAAFRNSYEDATYACAYATLEFQNTYYLAYRDLPTILADSVAGPRALDFGCGTGRSTRFLRAHGFDVTGVDIAVDMIREARQRDPGGDYRLMGAGDFSGLEPGSFDLVLSVFTFDNVPTRAKKVSLFKALGSLLSPRGRLINVVSSPAIYVNEWASFSTKDFPGNWLAGPGDVVRTIILDSGNSTPVEDVLWPDESYRHVFKRASLEVLAMHRPLARGDEPYVWISETHIAPWVIYVLKKANHSRGSL
jgi:SAM-dependent methyltransferase